MEHRKENVENTKRLNDYYRILVLSVYSEGWLPVQFCKVHHSELYSNENITNIKSSAELVGAIKD